MAKRKKNSVPTPNKKNKNRARKNKKYSTAELSSLYFQQNRMSRYEVFLERLESNPKFVGGIYGAFHGTLIGAIIFVVLLVIEPTRNLFVYFSIQFFSYLPAAFVPPKMFFPVHVIAPLMFIPLIGGALYGMRYGATQLPQHEDGSQIDFNERIWTFVILFGICCGVVILSLREHFPKDGLLNFFNSPVFFIPATVVLVAIFVWSFSTAKNKEVNNFRLHVYLLLGIVVAFVVMMLYTLQNMILYAIRLVNDGRII